MPSTFRKLIVLVCIVGLTGALTGAPALAGKKKKKKGSFSAENPVPWPGPDGCLESSEGVNKTTETMKAPFTGVLTVTMTDFDGDWDLFVTDSEGTDLGSATASQLTGDPPEEEVVLALKKGFEFSMVACNWLGGPTAEVGWTFVALK